MAQVCRWSTYLSVAVCTSLAAPLPGYVTARRNEGGEQEAIVAESATLNLAGESSTGKSETARIAASVVGHPDAYSSWSFTLRGLVESLAQHNDILLILDDFEKCTASKSDRAGFLRAVFQLVPDGHTKRIARK